MSNPNTEHIYKFEWDCSYADLTDTSNSMGWIKNCMRSKENGESMDCVIAGSYALWTLTTGTKSWKANDIDLFLLNRAQHARHNPRSGLLDIVHTTDKTPEEVITNFDLPCCRVAFDMNYTYYISIHALTALYTGKIYLPKYLKTYESFRQILKEYELEFPSKLNQSSVEFYHDFLIRRMSERIAKYQSRGFSFQWYETDHILPWIKQRFAYVNFDMMRPYPKLINMAEEDIKKELRKIKFTWLIFCRSYSRKVCLENFGREVISIFRNVFDGPLKTKYNNILDQINIVSVILKLSESDPYYERGLMENVRILESLINF